MNKLRYIIARLLPSKYRIRLPWVRRAYANLPPFKFKISPATCTAMAADQHKLLALHLHKCGQMSAEELCCQLGIQAAVNEKPV